MCCDSIFFVNQMKEENVFDCTIIYQQDLFETKIIDKECTSLNEQNKVLSSKVSILDQVIFFFHQTTIHYFLTKYYFTIFFVSIDKRDT